MTRTITHTVHDEQGRPILETNDYRLAKQIARRNRPHNLRPWLILLCIFAAMFAAYTAGCRQAPAPQPFRDGEGNIIPDEVVRLQVISRFANLDSTEAETVKRYFYIP